jgi:hypothetical protein
MTKTDMYNKDKAEKALKAAREVFARAKPVPWTTDDVKKEIDRGGAQAEHLLTLVLLASDLHDHLEACLTIPRVEVTCKVCGEDLTDE